MKISLNWLNDYIDIGYETEVIVELLSNLGFPCESTELHGDDTVIDIEITSNRGDCLGHIGLARELSVVTGKELKLPKVELSLSEKKAEDFVSVEIADADLCSRYTARVIEGVMVGQSPDWMKKRLQALGVRSVNNVVDATNYAMMETGQPPHAFDYDKINDGKIIVRKAKAGENIVSIDGSKCKLDAEMLIIADSKCPVAIAGVMGGLETEISESSKRVLLEDAWFKPLSVRTASRKLALPSEASFRFERVTDIENLDWASQRAAQLIVQVAGGKVAKGLVDVYPVKKEVRKVSLRISRLNALLGIKIPADEVVKILSRLSFQPQLKEGLVKCSVPSWRNDVYREVDLIEEVARVYGYGKIPTEQKIEITVAPTDIRQKLTQSIGASLNGCGFYETINVTFVDDSVAKLFTDKDVSAHLVVKDVSRKSANLLRQTLLASLLAVLKTNVNAGNSTCNIFEIADTFLANGDSRVEKTKLALVSNDDFRRLRGVIENVITGNINKAAKVIFKPTNLLWAQAGAEIVADGKTIGWAGVVSQRLRDKFDFKNITPVAAELDFNLLLALQENQIKVRPISKYPSIARDLSVIVDETVRWSDIAKAINDKASGELQAVDFVGIYEGKGIHPGKKSVTLTLTFRDEDGTLTHEIVDAFEADIVKNLADAVGSELRTPG